MEWRSGRLGVVHRGVHQWDVGAGEVVNELPGNDLAHHGSSERIQLRRYGGGMVAAAVGVRVMGLLGWWQRSRVSMEPLIGHHQLLEEGRRLTQQEHYRRLFDSYYCKIKTYINKYLYFK